MSRELPRGSANESAVTSGMHVRGSFHREATGRELRRTMLSKSRIARVAAGFVLLLGLTGCDDVPLGGDFELGFDGVNLLLVSCHDIEVTEVIVSEYIRRPDESKSQRVWEASGERALVAKDPLLVGGENEGLTNDLVRMVSPEAGIQYHVMFNDIPNRISSARFIWPEVGVAPGQWLSAKGDLHSEACEAARE